MLAVEKQDLAMVRMLLGLASRPEEQRMMLSAKVGIVHHCSVCCC